MFGTMRAAAHAYQTRTAPAPAITRRSGVGNQAQLRRLAHGAPRPSMTAKAEASGPGLVIGAENDPLEREADRIADQVMTAASPPAQRASDAPVPGGAPPRVSRKCSACDEEDMKKQAPVAASSAPAGLARKCAACDEGDKTSRSLRAAPLASGSVEAGAAAPASVDRVLGSAGRPLDTGERAFFEPRFGRDFGRVRLHADAEAGASARDVGALAYAVGEHVVVDPGRYRAGSDDGRRLMAHELAHVVQQGGAGAKATGTERSADGAQTPHTPQPALTPSVRRLQRYSHSNCSDSDLRTKVWPGDGIAKQMVDKAIRVLSATPVDPSVTPLLTRYFMSATPSLSAILAVYNKIKADFTANSYTYECNDDCDDCAYVRARMRYIGLNPNIHLCMNTVGAASATCFGYLIVHEFSHYSAHTDDKAYCHSGCCTPTSCPSSLSATDALDNADSYGAFANDLFPMSV